MTENEVEQIVIRVIREVLKAADRAFIDGSLAPADALKNGARIVQARIDADSDEDGS